MATPDHARLDRIVAEARRAADERAKGYRDDNPPDGSNWELLCLYCHDNEHSRLIDHTGGSAMGVEDAPAAATSNPFTDLKDLLKPGS